MQRKVAGKAGRLWPALMVGSALLAGALNHGAQAKILLKPNGKNAAPLRTKAVQAEVEIDGQFAHTRQIVTFQNEAQERIEADFLFSAPPHSIVTYFAYWYGEEKVVARIVEKDRAAQIYSYITTRMRDPALIEMIGQDTFRARIFPIQPNADLKVEIQTVQTLPSAQGATIYGYPLLEMRGAAVRLENLDLKVRARPDAGATKLTNNYGARVSSSGKQYSFAIKETNFRPPRDLQVRITRPAQKLQTSLFAARSGGTTGFFALALTPERDLKNPRLSVSGVRLIDQMPERLPSLKAHRVYTIVGRYAGSGAARIKLSDGAWSAEKVLNFSGARLNNNLATRLWAARRIAALSASARHEKEVVALSRQFALPSKWTSWLAIPEEERKRYKDEKEAAEKSWKLNATANRLTTEIAQGRGRSRKARTLQRELKGLARANDSDSTYVLSSQKEIVAAQIARAIADEKYSSAPNARRIANLKAQLNRVSGGGNGRAKSRLEYAENEVKSEKVSELAKEYLSEKYSAAPDAARLAALRRQAAKLKVSDLNADSIHGKYEWARDEMNDLLAKMVDELDKEKPDIARVRALSAKHRKIFDETFRGDAPNVVTEVGDDLRALEALETKRAQSGPAARKAINEERYAKLDELSRRQMAFGYGGGGGGDPLIAVEAPADSQQVVAVMPDGTTKQLTFNADTNKWEAHFDIPEGSAEGDWIITVIIVDKDGARSTLSLRFGIDATPPQGEAKAALSKNESALRLEMQAGADVSRVVALLPWGDKIELSPSDATQNSFFALAAPPPGYSGETSQITFVLTDRAHNRTTVTVDLSR